METYTGVCKRCKKLFTSFSESDYCPACDREIEAQFRKVRDYIRDNPGENIEQVAHATQTPKKLIMSWVKEERLQFSNPELVGLKCRKCGKIISTGMFCRDCKKELTRAFTEDGSKEPVQIFQGKVKKEVTANNRGRMNYIHYK
jgi:hypothetical protein